MAKTKKNKRNMADKVRTARTHKERKLNPFELRINKQKTSVLGRNQNLKGQVGNPGQARTKGYKERCRTLLRELKQSKKSNLFRDQRLGESSTDLSQDEKAIQRLALVRKAQHDRDKQVGRSEEDILTHRGQKLSEIEKFEDPVSDSDEEDDGRLSGKMVDEHFGGLMSRKTETDKLSWKDRMEQMIAESKQKKYERQQQKDTLEQKRDELDAIFRAEHELLLKSHKSSEKTKPKADPFDIRVRELSLSKRGTPSDRLKTEAELAKEEAERLQKLESDRKRRMLAENEENVHKSADSLDDGFGFSLLDTGKRQTKKVSFGPDSNDRKGDEEMSVDEEEEKSDGEEGGKESGDDEDDNKDSVSESEGDESGNGEDDTEEEEDSDDDDDDEEEELEAEHFNSILNKKLEEEKSLKLSVDLEEKKRIAEAAKQEIPYTFDAPATVEELECLLGQYCTDDQVTIVERLVTCHHPSIKQGNKEKLATLFTLLVQYLNEQTSHGNAESYGKLYDQLTPILCKLLKHNPESGSAMVLQLLRHAVDEFSEICQNRKGRGKFMGLETMLLLKLIQSLYSTSDFRHHITTPALNFMMAMLGQSPVTAGRDVAAGLYLCALCREYVSLSKRYIPEVIKFLHGCLYLASNKDPQKVEKVFRPFKAIGFFSNLLKVKEKVTDVSRLSIISTLANNVERQQLDTDSFRVSCINICVQLLGDYSYLYSELATSSLIFARVRDLLEKLPTDFYPEGLQDCIRHLKVTLKKNVDGPLLGMSLEKKKPQPLKLFEPKIEEVFEGRKKRVGSKAELEKQRLQHKLKREMKGAMREIRKDARFLAQQTLKETLKNDEERRQKLKRLYADLSTQEGEVKALKRQKNSTK